MSGELGQYQGDVDSALAKLKSERVISRIWAHDYTVWKTEPTEISNRLGWLHIAETMKNSIDGIQELSRDVSDAGYTHLLLLGMGGSSLAPELFCRTFCGLSNDHPDLDVLDSTDPGAVLAHAEDPNLIHELFVVSTKSGGTVETLSLFKFFYNRISDTVGTGHAGEHFIAITDPGSALADLAKRYSFRATFLNDSTIGGRYSALSYFGLVPATLVGVDVVRLLDRATTMMRHCQAEDDNPGAWLGIVMAELAMAGRDKLTLIASRPIASFGAWIEQLIAESTGKEGKGILPVDGEALGSPDVYGNDRLFVYLRMDGDDTYDTVMRDLVQAGHPVVRIDLQGLYDLGGEYFRWEMATAVAGYRLGINPFDQPNVESAKRMARDMVSDYEEKGALPALTPALQSDGITVYADVATDSLEEALNSFLRQSRPGDYIALQAYVQPAKETWAALQQLRTRLRDRLNLATTVGYGPRFLHSTGQLHKGDAGNGLFIQFTADDRRDAPIPAEAGSSASSIAFGALKEAQALGDRQALLDAGRRFIRFHLGGDVVRGLKRLMLS